MRLIGHMILDLVALVLYKNIYKQLSKWYYFVSYIF